MRLLMGPGAGDWVDKAPLTERLKKMMSVSSFERVRGYITPAREVKIDDSFTFGRDSS